MVSIAGLEFNQIVNYWRVCLYKLYGHCDFIDIMSHLNQLSIV